MIPLYTRYLTTSDYGTLQILDHITTIVALLFSFGISSAILRFYFQYDAARDKKQVVSTAYIAISVVTLLAIALLLPFATKISILVFGTKEFAFHIKIIFLSFFFLQQENIGFSFLLAQKKSFLYSLVSVSKLIIGLALNIYFVAILKKGVVGVLYSSLVSHIMGWIFLVSYTLLQTKLSFSLKKLREMINYGLPMIASAIGMFSLTFADRFFLQYYHSLAEVGIYSLGYKFGYLISFLVVQPFLLVWQAKIFEIAKKTDGKDVFTRVFDYFTFVAFFVALALSMLCGDLLRVIATPAFFEAHKVVPIIAFSYVIHGMYYNFYVGFLLEKQTGKIGAIVGSTAIFNLILNLLLIPRFDIYGAAVATAASFLTMTTITYIMSMRIYPVSYDIPRMYKLMITATAIYSLSLFEFQSIAISLMAKNILLVCFVGALFIVGYYREDERVLVKSVITRVFLKLKFVENQSP